MKTLLFFFIALAIVNIAVSCKCYVPYEEKYGVKVEELIKSKLPADFVDKDSLPKSFDWRNINGTSMVSRVLTQQNPAVCGSCWAEAATGALSDRYYIATGGKLQMQLAPQQLLNFYDTITGGGCFGGDAAKAYEFTFKYGLTDDTCAPFLGVNWPHGFEIAGMTAVEKVQDHMCYICDWNGDCNFVSQKHYDIYKVDEYGNVKGEKNMMAEIYSRGPIACSLNSEAESFNNYHGGIITCDPATSTDSECSVTTTDHVVVIAGWGVDKDTGMNYWVGRNSYGTRWGEGAGGGWFRLQRGVNALNMESHTCHWAVPAAADVERALQQYEDAL